MISTILLLPHADARERLLAPGAPVWVGADPFDPSPDAEFGWAVGRDVPQSDGLGESDHMDCVPVAWASIGVGHADPTMLHLVLARDGAEVYEGTGRLRRIIGAQKSIGFLIPPEVPPELHDAYRLARYAEWAGLGAPLLLGVDGSEVSP